MGAGRHHGINYRDVLHAEQWPDVYDGPNCDEMRPEWLAFAHGDQDEDASSEPLVFPPAAYPPGTIVTVSEPECPRCEEPASMCKRTIRCDSHWDEWCRRVSAFTAI